MACGKDRERLHGSQGGACRRRGTLAIPLLLAVGQMLLAMLMYRIMQIVALFAGIQGRRVARGPSA